MLVLARCRYLTMVLRRGELATADGCCLGITRATGARAELTWREAEAGVLCLSQDAAAVSATGRDLVLAAIQHRKAVIVIDLNGGSLAQAAGPPASSLADQIGLACAEVSAPLRRFAWQAGKLRSDRGRQPGQGGQPGARHDRLDRRGPGQAPAVHQLPGGRPRRAQGSTARSAGPAAKQAGVQAAAATS